MTWIRLLYSTPAYVGVMAAVAMALLAWLRGGLWERLGAGVIYLSVVISPLVQDQQDLAGAQYGFMAVDLAVFVAFTALALGSRLWWATWAAGFALFGVSIHLAMIADARVSVYAYYLGIGLCTYMLTFTVIIGTLSRHPLRWAPAPPQARKFSFRHGAQVIAFAALAAAIAFASIGPGPGSHREPLLIRLWTTCSTAYRHMLGLGGAGG